LNQAIGISNLPQIKKYCSSGENAQAVTLCLEIVWNCPSYRYQ